MPQWLDDILEGATKYEPLIKTGIAAASTYLSYEDQKKKNKLQQQAYNDYMQQVAGAGQEARAAIDVNYTPMTVSGVPQTKADVTDFTAVAARGGLMSVPNKQRKRYFAGTGQEDIEDIEVLDIDVGEPTTSDLEKETGLNFSGEQVFYDTGQGDRANAAQIWSQMEHKDKSIFNFDFDLFFNDVSWRDMIKSEAPVEGDTQMASDPSWEADWEDIYNDYKIKQINANQEFISKEEFIDMQRDQGATGGIIGLRHGGRPGYNIGKLVEEEYVDTGDTTTGIMRAPQDLYQTNGRAGGDEEESEYITTRDNDTFEVDTINRIYEEQGNEGLQAYLERNPDLKDKYVIVADGMSGELTIMPNKLHPDNIDMEKIIQLDFENLAGGNAKGGLPKRVRKAPGGIMNLGGLEKDYRTTGGFVPIGAYEKKDDVPARLSKNEFVMTADAVRAAGGGSINKGAQLMYDTMKHLEAQPQAQRMTV